MVACKLLCEVMSGCKTGLFERFTSRLGEILLFSELDFFTHP